MKENKQIDELFREKLREYKQLPPDYILENILSGASVNTQRKKTIFWRIAAVAAVLLLAFVVGWQYNAREGQDLKQATVATTNSGDNSTYRTEASPIAASKSSIPEKPMISSENIEKSNSARFAFARETSARTSTEESRPLQPLKSRSARLQTKTESARSLQERKTPEGTEKSIDQQIMEQNRERMMTQISEKEKGRWLVGAQVSPVRNVSGGSQSKVYASNMLNTESNNSVDLGVGLTVEYKPGKRWSLQSGVYYSGMEQTSGNSASPNSKPWFAADNGSEYLNTKVNVDAQTNKISMNSAAGVIEFKGVPAQLVIGNSIEANPLSSAVFISEAQFTQSFDYVEIPLYLRYAVLDKRFDVEMLGGFSSNVLVSNQAYLENSSGKTLIGTTKDMETMNYSGTLGVGLKYELSKRFFLNVEPRVKYYLNSLNSNESVTYKPYTIGVFTGLSYEF